MTYLSMSLSEGNSEKSDGVAEVIHLISVDQNADAITKWPHFPKMDFMLLRNK